MMVKKKKKKKEALEGLTDFAKSITNKKFRFSDWFAEKVIKTVAFLSIAFVILIFLFVFRETLPLFKNSKAQTSENITNGSETNTGNELVPVDYSANDSLQPETYSSEDALQPESYTSEEVLKPETYGTDKTLKPESYSSGEDSSENAALQPESYGDPVSDLGNVTEAYSNYGEEMTTAESNKNAIATLASKDWQPVSSNPRFGLLPLIIGTLKVTIIAMLFAAPLAILAALYTAMFAPVKIRAFIKPAIELLAGFPSVVIGFFALMVLASVLQNFFGYSSRLNGFVGGIAMGLAAIPIIYTLTEDALTAVPRTFYEASLGLGAGIRQTAFSVILPAATPGIFSALILGMGRVFGETMIALMATGNASIISANPFDSVRTLSATIGAEMAEVVFGDTHYSVLFLIGSLLFLFTFTFNAVAEFYLKNKMIKRIQGK